MYHLSNLLLGDPPRSLGGAGLESEDRFVSVDKDFLAELYAEIARLKAEALARGPQVAA